MTEPVLVKEGSAAVEVIRMMATVTVWPLASVPILAVVTPAAKVTGTPFDVVPETKVVPAGMGSVKTTPASVAGNVFEIVKVSVTSWPWATEPAEAVADSAGGPDPPRRTPIENGEESFWESVAVAVM